jgi:hypothetical protein
MMVSQKDVVVHLGPLHTNIGAVCTVATAWTVIARIRNMGHHWVKKKKYDRPNSSKAALVYMFDSAEVINPNSHTEMHIRPNLGLTRTAVNYAGCQAAHCGQRIA